MDDLDSATAAVPQAKVVVPRRTTFYGAHEIFVQDSAGTVVGFSVHQDTP